MNIQISINKKQHLFIILFGVILGVVLGLVLMNNVEFDSIKSIRETFKSLGEEISIQSASDIISFQKTTTLFAPILMCAGFFNGAYIYVCWIKQKNKKAILISIFLFPFVFMLIMFVGILSLIPFIIYNVYSIIKLQIKQSKG